MRCLPCPHALLPALLPACLAVPACLPLPARFLLCISSFAGALPATYAGQLRRPPGTAAGTPVTELQER